MMQEFRYKSSMQVPRLEKIVINLGLGEAIQNIKLLDSASVELTAIAGQKPVVTRAKNSIAAFKLQGRHAHRLHGDPAPGGRMYDFFDKLVNVVLPRVRDFRGLSRASPLTAGATTPWASRSRSSSRRSITTRSTRSRA